MSEKWALFKNGERIGHQAVGQTRSLWQVVIRERAFEVRTPIGAQTCTLSLKPGYTIERVGSEPTPRANVKRLTKIEALERFPNPLPTSGDMK